MNNSLDRKQFLREQVWSRSDIILNSQQDKAFEAIVQGVFNNLDFADFNRDQFFVQAYDYMVQQGVDQQDIALFLALFERSLNILETIENERDKLLTALDVELKEEEAAKEVDPDMVAQIRGEIALLTSGTIDQAAKHIQDSTDIDFGSGQNGKSVFAGPCVRTLLDPGGGNKRYTPSLKEKLSGLLGITEQAVASASAWRNGELNGRGTTVESLIHQCRGRLDGKPRKKKTIEKNPNENQQAFPAIIPDQDALNIVYSHIADNEYSAIAQELQPEDFSLTEAGKLTNEHRRWIYALFLLGLGDESGKQELRRFLADEIFNTTTVRVGAVSAHLSGKLRKTAELNKYDRWKDIEAIEKRKEEIDNNRKVSDKKDDDNSGSSGGGGGSDGNSGAQEAKENEVSEIEVSDDNLDESDVSTKPKTESPTNDLVVDSDDLIMAHADMEMERDLGIQPSELGEVFPSFSGKGEHFNFDNPEKRAWRRSKQEFINRNIKTQDRGSKKVVVTAGMQCYDVPHYIASGFKPENILVIEGGDDMARAECKKNAKKFGARFIEGRLEDGILENEGPFDVNDIDFLGQMCPTYFKILSNIPYSNDPILCFNVQGKRENLKRKYQYLNLPDALDTSLGSDLFKVDKLIPMLAENGNSALNRMLNPKSTAETRDKALLDMAMLALSSEMFGEYKSSVIAGIPTDDSQDLLGTDYIANSGLFLAWSDPKVLFNMLFPQLRPDELEQDLSRVVKRAWFGLPRLLDHQIYKYQSGSTPFVSQFIKAESCTPLLAKVEKLVRFCLANYVQISSSASGKSRDSLPDKREMDRIKKVVDKIRAQVNRDRRYMRLLNQIGQIMGKKNKTMQDLKKMKALLFATGGKIHGVKTKKRTRAMGVDNIEDMRRVAIQQCVEADTLELMGVSIEGISKVALGVMDYDDAIVVTQSFANEKISVQLADILSAINAVREFDSQDIYLKKQESGLEK